MALSTVASRLCSGVAPIRRDSLAAPKSAVARRGVRLQRNSSPVGHCGAVVAQLPGPRYVRLSNVGWTIGPESFTSKQFCLDLLNCFIYAPTLTRVNFQGPVGSPPAATSWASASTCTS